MLQLCSVGVSVWSEGWLSTRGVSHWVIARLSIVETFRAEEVTYWLCRAYGCNSSGTVVVKHTWYCADTISVRSRIVAFIAECIICQRNYSNRVRVLKLSDLL